MSFDLNQIKLKQFDDKLQVTIFDLEGNVLDSCNSVLDIKENTSVFDQFLFLKSLEEVFISMPEDEEQRFSEVEWEEGKHGLFHLIFKKVSHRQRGHVIQWTIIDNTFYYDKLLNLQQSRNESAISEEFAQIKRRVIEAEKDLLEFKNLELERIQQFKSEFFAKVSHEMRTPLNSIAGLVDLLSRGGKEDYLGALKSTSRHLNAIINDLLDLSKIESGKLEFESIDFDLQSTLKAITDGFRFACEDKGIELNVSLPNNPMFLKGDPTRLSQIIYNLLGNSIKFTDAGSVNLAVKTKELENNELNLFIEVSDSGIGMDKSQITKILEPYGQASGETSRLYGGTGLGLGIAKQLVEAFGGELLIESEPGMGTSMSFTITMSRGEAVQQEEIRELNLSNVDVLLAEDDQVSGAVIKQQLLSHGASVKLVSNADELSTAIKGSDYDIIITDINLSLKSGIEVFKETRDRGESTPFLFVSGDQLASDQIATEHQNWRFLMKPVDSSQLISTVDSMVLQSPIKVDLTKIRTMIDDEAFVADLLQTILDTLPAELERLNEMSGKLDFIELRKILHKIKPSISYLGVESLAEQRQALHKETSLESQNGTFEMKIQRFIETVELALKNLEKQIHKD